MNTNNLKPFTSEQSHEAAVKNGRKGGIACRESRERKKLLKECLEILLERDVKGSDGATVPGAEAISVELFNKALSGDIKAFEVIRDTVGQKPAEKVAATQTVVDLSKFTTEEIKAMLDDEI